MNIVKNHFEQEAPEYDEIILKLIPYYPQMLDALISSVPFPKHAKIRVIDLGCGTGIIAKKIKESFPNALVHCVDIAENMIQIAKQNLSGYSDITFENADLSCYTFIDSYDAALSSLALHHLLTDKDKFDFYSKIFAALKPGGVFYNADTVIGSNDVIQENNMAHWIGFMGKTESMEDIEQKWLVNYKREDRPAQLMKHLSWLRDAGFRDIDVVWKYYNFGVFGGCKP